MVERLGANHLRGYLKQLERHVHTRHNPKQRGDQERQFNRASLSSWYLIIKPPGPGKKTRSPTYLEAFLAFCPFLGMKRK